MKRILSIFATATFIAGTGTAVAHSAVEAEIAEAEAHNAAFAAKFEETAAKFEHEKVENFTCETDSENETITISWDEPTELENVDGYHLHWNVTTSGEWLDHSLERIEDTEFTYNFADLDKLKFNDYQSLHFSVNAVTSDGHFSPASASANIIHHQLFAPEISIEKCE